MPEKTDLTLAALHAQARHGLDAAGIAGAALDARLIVEHFTGTSRTDALVRPDWLIPDAAIRYVQAAILRRAGGEPVHRILGFRDFYGLRLSLSPETLEPRPDTETLVDALLPFVRACVADCGSCRILDLGTGSGAIALALLANVPGTTALGVDISRDALRTARQNAEGAGVGERFETLCSDWFAAVSGTFHAVAANPPYIPSNEIASLQSEVRNFDPSMALDGGGDGLVAYRAIAQNARMHLKPNGVVAVEIGSMQAGDVTAIFEAQGFETQGILRDLASNDRVILFA